MEDNKRKKSTRTAPVTTELLARTLEHMAQTDPSKLNRDRKMQTARIFRERVKKRQSLH